MTNVTIAEGYRPGAIGRCLELQAKYYAQHHGFGRHFEIDRALDIAGFFARANDLRSRFWCALRGDEIVGTIAIDASDLGAGVAHLRWFVTAEILRGTGVGKELLATALGHVDDGDFIETQLWTFRGLDAARKLYESAGFMLRNEYDSDKWGPNVREQHFVRTHNRAR